MNKLFCNKEFSRFALSIVVLFIVLFSFSFGETLPVSAEDFYRSSGNKTNETKFPQSSHLKLEENNLAIELSKIFISESNSGQFGFSVAINGDTAIVGAKGAAYIFVKTGASWTFQQKLTASDETAAYGFGEFVDIDGDTVIISAPYQTVGTNLYKGAVYIFVRSGTSWSQQQKLIAAEGGTSDCFGCSVSISQDTVIIGAGSEDIGGNLNQGAAYVFTRNGTAWSRQAKLRALDSAPLQIFGSSVSISGDKAVVGAAFDSIGTNSNQGSAYVFSRSGTEWTQQAKLIASDGGYSDNFGNSVDIQNDTVVVGAYREYRDNAGISSSLGAAYVFTKSDAGWTEQAKLYATDIAPGAAGDQFGNSVALDGNTIVIGAPGNNGLGLGRSGSAYLFSYRNGVWTQQAKLFASDTTGLTQQFGTNVSISGSKIFVNSPYDRSTGVEGSFGSVYFFVTPIFAPDLQAASDSGASDGDNITNKRALSFDIKGFSDGASVSLLRDGVVVASGTASGEKIVLTDNNTPADGAFKYTTQQIFNNEVSSPSDVTLVTVDNSPPTGNISRAAGQPASARIQPINFSVIFNESIVGFDPTDISLTGSTANVSSANIVTNGSGSTYNVGVNNILSDGTVVAGILPNSVQDLAGNISATSTVTDNSVTFDTVSPTVTINQADSQIEPTGSLPVNFTVVFSERVTGFTSADVLLTGSTAGISSASIIVSGSGTTYNVAVNNVTSNGGFVQAGISGGAAADAAGNQSIASTSIDNQITVDNIGPTVTINQASGQIDPTNILPVNFTVTFNEPVTGFDSADISFNGSIVNTFGATIIITGSGATYNVAVGNITADGLYIRASIISGAVSDSIGNLSSMSTGFDNQITIDNIAPTVIINQSNTQSDPTSKQPIRFTVIFSEPVTGFNAADVSLSGSTANVSFASITVTGSSNFYTVSIQNITSGGQIVANILAGVAQDTRGNLSLASTSIDNTITVNVRRAFFDFDGDSKTDISIFRLSVGEWWYLKSSNGGNSAFQFGSSTDKIVPADYTGDGKTDIAFFRPSSGEWFILRSEDNSFFSFPFGTNGDVPAPADYDGDGKADAAVFRPSNNTWFISRSTGGTKIEQFGIAGDVPVTADYDGDGKSDIAIYRPSDGQWWLSRSSLGVIAFQFGVSTDKPVQGDYTGDGKTDVAFFRPSTNEWFILRSENNSFYSFPFGAANDIPSPGDYDGDGKLDAAIFRPSNNTWFVQRSTSGTLIQTFGQAGDLSVPNAFVP